MESVKKMILIEPEVIERLKTDNSNESIKNLSRFDEEMHNVLKSKIDDREKWALYLQTLQRYLHFIGETRKPLQLPLLSCDEEGNVIKGTVNSEQGAYNKGSEEGADNKGTSTETNQQNIYSKSLLLGLIPKSYQSKGGLLVDILLKNNDKIFWNDKGVVFINKREISKSNIIDLLNDILRPLKSSSPNGWVEFARCLEELKVPLSYIGNPKRATYMKILTKSPNYSKKDEETETSEHYFTPKITTSSSGDQEKRGRKINWERWTPY